MHIAAVWLRSVKQELGAALDIEWQWFALEQVNSVEGPEWKVWERPAGHRSRSLLAFSAGEAARRQGSDAFERFHIGLLQARHVDGLALQELETVTGVAEQSGLDMARFERDLADPTILASLEREHQEGAQLGVFGTPTLVFEYGRSAFLKMRPAPPEDEALDVFNALRTLVTERTYIAEIKRPTPP